MKITKWVEFEKEIDVHIGLDDIKAVIRAAFAAVGDNGRVSDIPYSVCQAVTYVAEFLKGVTDAQISMLTFKKRTIIERFLREQADRYRVDPEAML